MIPAGWWPFLRRGTIPGAPQFGASGGASIGWVPGALSATILLVSSVCAWMFPKSSGANIGLGIQRRFAKGRSLNQYAEAFISKYDGEISFNGAGSLPMSGSIRNFVKGNYLLVGDAAGMVLPSNGAGITIGMIGGRIAGQVIAEHLTEGTSLTEYERRWDKQMGRVMRNSKRAFRFGNLMFRLPNWMLNISFNPLTRGIIWRAVTCRRMFWIF